MNGFFRGIRLEKQAIQRNGCYGLVDFSVFIKQAFADGKIDAPVSKLMGFSRSAVEAVDDPSLLGLILLVKPEYVGRASYVVDNERFLVLLGKQDVFFKKLELKRDGVFVGSVDAGFADGGDAVFFQEGF